MIRRHRFLVIGRQGQLAQALAAADWPSLSDVQFAGRDEIDLFHPVRLRQQIAAFNPELIINAAGYADIERAEQEPEAAFRLNAEAVEVLASATAMLNIPLLHFSSAHVFSGIKAEPYRENDRTEPLSVYGQSMLTGEAAIKRARGPHVILRTSRLFGLHGNNFMKSMLALGRTAEELAFTTSGYSCPTPTAELAALVPHIAAAMIEGRRFPAILHYAGDSAASWHEIATEVFAIAAKFQPVPRLLAVEAMSQDGQQDERAAKRSNLALDWGLARSLGLPRINWRADLPALIETLCHSDAQQDAQATGAQVPGSQTSGALAVWQAA